MFKKSLLAAGLFCFSLNAQSSGLFYDEKMKLWDKDAYLAEQSGLSFAKSHGFKYQDAINVNGQVIQLITEKGKSIFKIGDVYAFGDVSIYNNGKEKLLSKMVSVNAEVKLSPKSAENKKFKVAGNLVSKTELSGTGFEPYNPTPEDTYSPVDKGKQVNYEKGFVSSDQDFENLLSRMIGFKVGDSNPSKIITIAFDPLCPYCQKMHSMILDSLDEFKGVAFEFIPVGILKEESALEAAKHIVYGSSPSADSSLTGIARDLALLKAERNRDLVKLMSLQSRYKKIEVPLIMARSESGDNLVIQGALDKENLKKLIGFTKKGFLKPYPKDKEGNTLQQDLIFLDEKSVQNNEKYMSMIKKYKK